MLLNWINKLDRKFGRHYIHNLMGIIIAGSAALFIIDYVLKTNIRSMLYLEPALVLQGQIWRLVTFVFVMNPGNIVFAVFAFYFYYIAGNALEYEWGGFKFNLYYLVGMISAIVISFITMSSVTADIINLSLFLAYAKLYPNAEFLLFFILPIKAKYLGYFNWAIIILGVLQSIINFSIQGILINLVPVINYLLFFGASNYREKKMRNSSVIRMKDYKRKINSVKKSYTHKCTVCGITDVDDPDMEFRYCSRCNGKHAYCEKHILDHEHIK